MKTESIRPMIVIVVVVTLLSAFIIPPGEPRYRLKERILAMEAYDRNPSKATKAALDNEFAQLHHHEAIVGDILVPSVLFVNAAVIYFFWNYGKRASTKNGQGLASAK